MRKIIALLLCAVLLPVQVAARKGFVKGELGEELDGVMAGFVREGYAGAVLVARNGERKIFTAAAVLKLETQGRLKTSDLISKYPGDFPGDKSGATMVRRGGGRPDFESELQWYVDENTAIIFAVNNDLNFRRRVAPAIERVIWRK